MNLTLSVDANTIERARRAAAAMGMSLNEVVREYLAELAGQSSADADIAEVRHLSTITKGDSSGWHYDRDEIHERP